jgi:hypothetical protein
VVCDFICIFSAKISEQARTYPRPKGIPSVDQKFDSGRKEDTTRSKTENWFGLFAAQKTAKAEGKKCHAKTIFFFGLGGLSINCRVQVHRISQPNPAQCA